MTQFSVTSKEMETWLTDKATILALATVAWHLRCSSSIPNCSLSVFYSQENTLKHKKEKPRDIREKKPKFG